MDGFSPANCDIDILEGGRSMDDFIDDRIKERDSKGSEEPFFVLNLDRLYMRHLRWVANLPRVRPFYAVKCNNTPAVLRLLRALGAGFDCASKNEINLALSLGATPDDIIYAHSTKPLSHIRHACTRGIDMMTFDNMEELMKISLCHPKAKLVLRIVADDSKSSIKLSSKFGARLEAVGELLGRAKELELDVFGVSFHVGSGCSDSLVFRQAIADARHAFNIASFLGFQMKLLDIGGGFSGDDKPVTFEKFSEVINAALDEFFPADCGVEVISEPGRYYVESNFTLVANVIAKKVITDDMDEHRDGEEHPYRLMMYYINDGVYGSLSCVVNDPALAKLVPQLHRAVESSEQRYRTIIWGPTCDSADRVSDGCCLPEMYIGDWLLIDNRGAYSVTLCTDFNGFERAHVYSVVTAETWQTLNLSHKIIF